MICCHFSAWMIHRQTVPGPPAPVVSALVPGGLSHEKSRDVIKPCVLFRKSPPHTAASPSPSRSESAADETSAGVGVVAAGVAGAVRTMVALPAALGIHEVTNNRRLISRTCRMCGRGHRDGARRSRGELSEKEKGVALSFIVSGAVATDARMTTRRDHHKHRDPISRWKGLAPAFGSTSRVLVSLSTSSSSSWLDVVVVVVVVVRRSRRRPG